MSLEISDNRNYRRAYRILVPATTKFLQVIVPRIFIQGYLSLNGLISPLLGPLTNETGIHFTSPMSVKWGSMPHPSRHVSTTSTHSKTKNHSSENVQVAVRCRPMSASEARVQRQVCWDINTTLNSIVIAEGYERQNRERHIYHYGKIL
jgi:hypothetical protein